MMHRQSRWDRASCWMLVFGCLGGCPCYRSLSETWTASSSYSGGQDQHPEFLMSGLLSKTISVSDDTPQWLACLCVTLQGRTPASCCLLMWTGPYLCSSCPAGTDSLATPERTWSHAWSLPTPLHLLAMPAKSHHDFVSLLLLLTS